MRFLARREHTRVELRRKLVARAQEGEDVDGLLDELTQRGWLSDARFAEQAARAKARRFGPIKLAHYLKARGVGEEAIAAGLRGAGAEGVASLEAVWRTRFRARPPTSARRCARCVSCRAAASRSTTSSGSSSRWRRIDELPYAEHPRRPRAAWRWC